MSALFSIVLLAANAPIISQVVVYPDRAQVTRTVELPCGPRAIASFTGIPPSADAASFRARTNLGAIEGLRSEARTREESFAGEVKDLDGAIRKLEGEAAVLRDAQARGEGAGRRATQYGEVALALLGREMSDGPPNVKAWEQAWGSTLAARLRAAADSVDTAAKLRDLEVRLGELRRRRQRLGNAAARRELAAEVLVSCPSGKQAEVELTYLVGGAAWEPAYEARADESGGAVELSAYATVSQTTGESWQQAKVILSTAVPRQNATPPELQPLSVWAEERAKERKVLVRREEEVAHAETGKQDEGGKDSDGRRMGVAAQGLSVQLVVPGPSDVAGDGTPARLFIARTRIKAQFAFRTAPRAMPFVFRVADLTNSAPFPLLPGALDAFRRGGLTGRYPLARIAEGQRFHLTFGIEEGLRVKRTVVEEVKRDSGLLGNDRRFRFAYRFEVESYLGRPETVELADQIPLSELDDVKVVVDLTAAGNRPATSPGYDTRGDDGILTWRLPLKPGEKRTVDLAFHVDVPASYDSGGL